MGHLHDIAVLGATPAGLAAAYRLARKGRDVAVVAAPARGCESPLADWVPGGFFRSAGMPAGLVGQSRAEAFRCVCYHSADLARRAAHRSRAIAGYLLESSVLARAMRSAARKAGAKFHTATAWPTIRAGEESVAIHGPGVSGLSARLLVIADGPPAETLSSLSLPAHGLPGRPMTVAGLDVPLPRRSAGRAEPPTLHVVESRERTDLGMFFIAGGSLHLRMISTSPAAGSRAGELSAMVAGLQQGGLLADSLALGRARGAVWHPPAAVALDLDTHVAKRCLLAGSAGGFADAITGQTLAPTVQSALLAADVADEALGAAQPQAALGRYKTAWRDALAETLRPPSTSLQMLMPLLFVNRQVVERFSAALLTGAAL